MLNEIRIQVAEFLGKPLINKEYLFLDSWALVHLISGIFLMILIFKFFKDIKNKKKFLLLLGIIILWEIYEMNASWIRGEQLIDITYDIIVGMIGGSLGYYYKKN